MRRLPADPTVISTGQVVAELDCFFTCIRPLVQRAELVPGGPSLPELKEVFADVGRNLAQAEKAQRTCDRRRASRFNVFDFIDPDENKLSDVLAFLLDPKGAHGQGDLFLRLFFKQLKLQSDRQQLRIATVRREASTHGILKSRRRMDVLVDAGTLVAIENKVDAMEQPEQVKDYLAHLRECTRHRSRISALVYLTPNGRSPESLGTSKLSKQQADENLHCWSYHKDLRTWLDNCRRECAAPRIQYFITDLLSYIEGALKRAAEPESEDDNEE
jgi:hypothetical protein